MTRLHIPLSIMHLRHRSRSRYQSQYDCRLDFCPWRTTCRFAVRSHFLLKILLSCCKLFELECLRFTVFSASTATLFLAARANFVHMPSYS